MGGLAQHKPADHPSQTHVRALTWYEGEYGIRLSQFLSFAGGLLGGAIVGAAVVTLLAPRSGAETRQQIAVKFQEITDAGRQAIAERRQQLRTDYEEAIRIPLPLGGSEAG